jgi:hypothetical protein
MGVTTFEHGADSDFAICRHAELHRWVPPWMILEMVVGVEGEHL